MDAIQEIQNETRVGPAAGDKVDKVLSLAVNVLVLAFVMLPQIANADTGSAAFAGITAFLKSITNLFIFEWGYYIGIITLAIQGYRCKTGRIDYATLCGWGLGIGLVFFAPNIVSDLKSRAGSIA